MAIYTYILRKQTLPVVRQARVWLQPSLSFDSYILSSQSGVACLFPDRQTRPLSRSSAQVDSGGSAVQIMASVGEGVYSRSVAWCSQASSRSDCVVCSISAPGAPVLPWECFELSFLEPFRHIRVIDQPLRSMWELRAIFNRLHCTNRGITKPRVSSEGRQPARSSITLCSKFSREAMAKGSHRLFTKSAKAAESV